MDPKELDMDQVAADLEKSITAETLDTTSPDALAKSIRDAITTGITDVLAKAKGAIPTDLKQEKAPKDKTVTGTESDPAKTARPSGPSYPDSSRYYKGDDDDGDADGKGDDKRPSYFGKKGKGKGKKDVKKSDEGEGDADEDVTETIDQMAKAMDDLGDRLDRLQKAIDTLTDGTAAFGEVVAELAEKDPRKDNLQVTMAKAIEHLVGKVNTLEKALGEQKDLVKAVAELPGAPRAVSAMMAKAQAAAAAGAAEPGAQLSQKDQERLYKAAVEKKISIDEYKTALAKADTSVLERI